MVKQIHVAYAKDDDDARRMMDALRDAGISASLEGGIRDIYSIGSAEGQEIMTAPEDAERARDIILSMQPDASVSEPEKKGHPAFRGILAGIAALFCIIALACIRAKTGA